MTRTEAEEKARDAWRMIEGEWGGTAAGAEESEREVEEVLAALAGPEGVVSLVPGTDEARRAAYALEDGSAMPWAHPWKDELADLARRLRGEQ
jgi:hypothetical protein